MQTYHSIFLFNLACFCFVLKYRKDYGFKTPRGGLFNVYRSGHSSVDKQHTRSPQCTKQNKNVPDRLCIDYRLFVTPNSGLIDHATNWWLLYWLIDWFNWLMDGFNQTTHRNKTQPSITTIGQCLVQIALARGLLNALCSRPRKYSPFDLTNSKELHYRFKHLKTMRISWLCDSFKRKKENLTFRFTWSCLSW